jgi:hypothetical protein
LSYFGLWLKFQKVITDAVACQAFDKKTEAQEGQEQAPPPLQQPEDAQEGQEQAPHNPHRPVEGSSVLPHSFHLEFSLPSSIGF